MSKRVVLVVEDLPSLRETVKKDLEEENFKVETAVDYHGAIKVLQTCVPDLLVVDLTLPRESGFDLVEKIRQTPGFERVPIIVTSERGYPEDMANAEAVGANAFLKKPFTKAQLKKYVGHILDGPHASRPSVRRLEVRRHTPSR